MSFLNPEFLYYMLPPLFILFALLLTQKESVVEFFSKEVAQKLRVSSNTLTLKARNALFLLMGFFIILALAKPVIKEGKIEVRAKSADILIALDISDSMLATDVYPNRLEAAKQKALFFINGLVDDRVGVVAFAKNSYLVSPLSFDKSTVSFLLRELSTSSITEKGTDFLALLKVVAKTQKDRDRKYLLLFSDGGDKSDFSQEIAFAKKNGITIFVVGVATKKGSPIKLQDGSFVKYKGEVIVSKLNENIADLALKSGGVYIEATNSSSDIKAMLGEIASISDKKELKSKEVQKYTPLFYYPIAAALFILLIATSSMGKLISKKASLVFVPFLLALNTLHVEAGILDFMDLKEAKEAYESSNFEKSKQIYEEYAQKENNPSSYFNAANSLYKQKKFKEAITLYEKAKFDDKKQEANRVANMANAYAKQDTQESLLEAKKRYEESLELSYDKEVQENLQEVLKRIKEKKKESEQNSQDEQKEQEKESDKDSKSDDKNSEGKEEKSDSKEDSKEESTKDSSDDSKAQDDKKSSKEQESKEADETQNESKANESKPAQDKIEELKKSDENGSSSNSARNMSDAEEQKWIQELNSNKNTYMYKLNDEEPKKSDDDQKPW